MQTVEFGSQENERIAINVIGYERSASGEVWDDNWLSVEVAISVGAFHGKYQASFMTGELEELHEQLAKLLEALTGNAEFSTLEGQLSLALVGDGLGHIQIKGEARDEAGIGNRLSFSFAIDQTQLQSSVRALGTAIAAYPVRT